MDNWLTRGVVSSIIAAVLVAGAGIVIGYFKQKGAAWVTPMLYGLASAALVGVIIATFVGLQAIPPRKPQVTPENAERYIKVWAENNGLGITKPQTPIPDSYFSYVVTLKNGNPIIVFRAKGNANRLDMHTQLMFSEEHQKEFAKLGKEEASDVIQQISLQLGIAKLGNTIMTATPMTAGPGNVIIPFAPQVGVDVLKGIPLNDLDEDTFLKAVDEIDSGVTIVKATTALALRRKKTVNIQ